MPLEFLGPEYDSDGEEMNDELAKFVAFQSRKGHPAIEGEHSLRRTTWLANVRCTMVL